MKRPPGDLEQIHDGNTRRTASSPPLGVTLLLRYDKRKLTVRLDRRVWIGRGEHNDVPLADDQTVSYRHCFIEPDEGQVRVVDLSGNGVQLDGTHVGEALLKAGVTLTVGQSTMRIVGEAAPRLANRGHPLLGDSPPMQQLRHQIARIALSDLPVVVLGETGSGKEATARAIHAASPRAAGPFVACACASLTNDLAESALFGHERGAFTSAEKKRLGYFERADGGTLFLDELAEVPLLVQAKLLRVLQEGTYERVGGDEERHINVRVVAATNADLRQMTLDLKFRQDLYFRLDGNNPLRVPSLRDRRGDIPMLVGHFLDQVPLDRALSDEAMAIVCNGYDWPGNVRELQTTIQGGAYRASGKEIAVADLWPYGVPQAEPKPAVDGERAAAARITADQVRDALTKTAGNVTQAAILLGIGRSTLHERLRVYGIDAGRYRR